MSEKFCLFNTFYQDKYICYLQFYIITNLQNKWKDGRQM
jgi:hypothetical protein